MVLLYLSMSQRLSLVVLASTVASLRVPSLSLPPLPSPAATAAAVMVSCAVAFGPAPHALAATSTPEAVPCDKACFKECDAIAPGNEGYCKSQCDTYCADAGPIGSADVLRTDVTAAVPTKDCSGYRTDKAKGYCEAQNQKAIADALPRTGLEMNNGIFGDSGVAYSKGVEDLFATAFGATRQNKNVKEADLGAFAADIGDAARAALLGK